MSRNAKTNEIRAPPIHSPWRVGKFSDLETDSGFETIGIVLTHWLFHCSQGVGAPAILPIRNQRQRFEATAKPNYAAALTTCSSGLPVFTTLSARAAIPIRTEC